MTGRLYPGLFSPIEDVVRQAEERAVREWELEHRTPPPCDHPVIERALMSIHGYCGICGEIVPDR